MATILPARKYAEVEAFAELGILMLDRSGEAGVEAFGRPKRDVLYGMLTDQKEFLAGMSDQQKRQRTLEKLIAMMEQYVGDNWDNPLEILEWCGFYFGSASVHWEVVSLLTKDADSQRYCRKQADQFMGYLSVCRQTLSSLLS